MDFILFMFIALAGSFLLGETFNKLGFPKVLGPMFIGLLMAVTPFRAYLSSSNLELVDVIKDIAIIFLMFFVGLKIDINDFRRASRRSLLIGFIAAIIPLIVGFFSVILLSRHPSFSHFFAGSSNIYLVGFIVGVCLSVTAEWAIIEILEELGLIKTVIGETILEAGIIDDLLMIFFISTIVALVPSNSEHVSIGLLFLKKVLDMILFAGVLLISAIFLLPKIMKVLEKKKSTTNFFAVSIMVALFLAILANYLDLGGSILGALFAGVIIRYSLLSGDMFERREEKYITDIIEVTTFGLFAPFFFIWIGISVKLSVLFSAPLFTFIFVLMAILSKMVGSLIGNRISKGRTREGWIIGWGMISKGGVEIMVATLAFSEWAIISEDLFSVLMFMSFAMTMLSPTMFKILVKRHHGIR